MALARNLRKDKKHHKFDINKIKKQLFFGFIFFAILIGSYGVLNLIRVAKKDDDKAELKMETGDRPLPSEIPIWITADGGLFMRETPDPKGKIIILVPKGTSLSATELRGEWYRVTYMNKSGWLNKGYVTTEPPKEDPTKNWKTFLSKDYGYSLRYPSDWVVQDYGSNPASSSLSYVGLGSRLSPNLISSSPPPIVIRISSKTKSVLEDYFSAMTGSVREDAIISGFSASKYTYSSSQGVQMTSYVIEKSTQVIIIEETGGFYDDLQMIISTFNLS